MEPKTLLKIIVESALIVDLIATSVEEVAQRLVDALVAAGVVPESARDAAIAATLAREARGTTALGAGVAIPHAEVEGLDRACATVAIAPGDGAPYNALDGENVRAFFFVLTSPDLPKREYLVALDEAYRLACNAEFMTLFKQTRTTKDALQMLENPEGALA